MLKLSDSTNTHNFYSNCHTAWTDAEDQQIWNGKEYVRINSAVGEKEDFIQLPCYELILLYFLSGGGQ